MSGTGGTVPDLLDGLAVDQGIVLLPVRLETRFVTDDTGSKLRVRVYPDDIHIDAHQTGLTDGEVAAAGRYWDAVWRSGRGQPDAERAAFVQLADRVGVTRAVWVARATHPDETDRPADPVPEGQPLATPPVLAPVSRIDSTFAGPAVARLLPDRWVVIGYRGGGEVFREVGAPIPESLPVGPAPREPAAPGAPSTDPNTIPLDDELRWLADIDAAVAVGMAVDVPLAATEGLDRLVVVGVRAHETADESAARLGELLDAQRFTSGLGFVEPGAPTNNTAGDRSAWSRRPDAAAVFDAEQLHDPEPTTFAASTATALGVRVDALLGLEDASIRTGDSEGALLVALWPATVGYFLEQLLQPIVDDPTIEGVRRLFVGALRSLGPLPALRIGAQPYGVLPVTSLARWQPASSEGPQSVVVRLVRILVPEWLAATRSGARTVPHVGRPGADPDQELLDILARDALSGSYRLRPVRGGASARALRLFTPDLDGAGDALADATLRLLGGGSVIPRLTGFEFEPRTARIRRPVVIAGELSETDPLPADAAVGLNYLAFLASRRDHTDGFSGPGSTSILFKLAQHACQLADADAAVRLTRPASVAAVKAVLEPDLVDAVAARPSQTMPRLLARSVRDVAAEPTLPDETVGDFLATVSDGDLAHLGLPDVTNAVRRATIVRNALGRLADEPTAALDRMTRAVIDACSHRLDAWITAFATQRLAAVRATQPAGVHVGGFGWVEDLQPKVAPSAPADPPADEPGPLVTDPTNAGYVVAPSLSQAATAGILLSGHLSHAAGGGDSAPFAVDLSSDRVRLASWLVDGIRQGQPLGALLGYRFERNLHERSGAGMELDRFIRPLRAVAPLVADRSDDVAPTVEAVESVAASNVVDGLSLLTRFRANPDVVTTALAGASPEEHDAVIAELAGLGETADAVADLVTAETVHQLVSGQVARTAASLDALGSGLGPPPEPEVNETPRSGSAYEHRLIALAPLGTEVPEGWSTGADRPRRVAEPRLDALSAAVLGRADAIRAVVRVSGPGTTSPTLVEATVADLGRCALDVAYGAIGAPSRIELDLVDHVRAQPDVARDALVEVVHEDDADWPASTWPVGSIPMDDALDQARWLAEALGAGRPLSASDLAVGDRSGQTGARRDELGVRQDVVTARYRAAAAALTDARDRATDPSATDPAARLVVALEGLAAFGVVTAEDAVHAARSGVGDGLETLRAAAEAVLAEIAPVLAGLDQPVPADGAGSVPLPEVESLRSMFGPSFVVLPLVDVPEGWAEAHAASSAPAFLRGDAAAPAAWLQQVARVRAPVDRYLWAVSGAGRFDAVQLPPAPTWVALPLDPGAAPPAAATSIVLHTHEPAAGPALTGVVIDTWADTIPAARTTVGVAFNFDEPGARPPQAVLLALPPELGAPWTLDALVDVVREAADLARVRMVGPDEAPWLGRYLPALYIADNPLGDTIGIDLASLVTRDAGGGP